MSASIVPPRTAAETALLEAYSNVKPRLPGTAAVAKLRQAAFDLFSKAGLPHRRIETWHYTDLRNLMREALPLAPVPSADALASLGNEMRGKLPPQSLVLVDGVFAKDLSSPLPKGVTVTSLASALAEGRSDIVAALSADWSGTKDSIVALNAAMMQDGVVIEIAPGTKIEEPIRLIYATVSKAPAARFSRSLLIVGKGASVVFNEESFGKGARTGQTNNALVIVADDDANLVHTFASTDTQAGS
ncbi:MAG TPA: SufD family Fe-S cluster assembly protein, partial [Methylovirgula sp.]